MLDANPPAPSPDRYPTRLDVDTIELVESALVTTRSVRQRLDLDRAVDPEDIRACLRIAACAPTGGDRQAWHFVVVTDETIKRRLGELYRRAFEEYVADGRLTPAIGASVTYLAENIDRCPALVIAGMTGRWENLAPANAQAGYWGSVLPAMWSFMISCRLRGLGTTWTTMHLRYEREAAEILGIPYEEFAQCALTPVAHIVGDSVGRAPRKDVDTVIHWDQW